MKYFYTILILIIIAATIGMVVLCDNRLSTINEQHDCVLNLADADNFKGNIKEAWEIYSPKC